MGRKRKGTLIYSFADTDNYLGFGDTLHTFEVDYLYYFESPAFFDYYGGCDRDSADFDLLAVRLINNDSLTSVEKKYCEDTFSAYIKEFESEYYSILEAILINETEDCYDD